MSNVLANIPGQVARTRRFTLGVPGQFTIMRGGAPVLFLRSRAGDDPLTCLWALDPDSGTERLLADPAGLPDGSPSGITTYATSRDGGLASFALGGALWTVEVCGAEPRRLPATGPVTDPRPDPAGRRIAYVSEGALRVIGADGSGDRLIAAPDGPDVTFGSGEHTTATSPDGPLGHWWSPDGTRLLALREDRAKVARWHIADPSDPGGSPTAIRYPAAGTPNPDATLWIMGLDGSRVQAEWDHAAFEYVVGAGWDARGPYAVVQSRDQRTVRFLAIDTGSGHTTTVAEQRDDRWVQLVPGLPVRMSDGALVAHTDDAGTRRLTVAGVTVTPVGLQLRAVLSSDDGVLFTASREPTQIHLWLYGAPPGLRRLSTGPGVHTGTRRDGTLVQVARGPGQPGGQTVVRRESAASVPRKIAHYAERPGLTLHATPLVLGPRELRAMLYLPSWHRPGTRLPVLADPYGGAGMQRVTAEAGWACHVSQWFAEQGFAVLVADGAGTPGRGPEWEREVHGDLFGPALEDQVSALREAARLYPDLDLGRVGIRGWSFGGALALAAVLRRPDVFHAAVAGAGVTDQRLYNAHWRERFLGHPDEFAERYAADDLVRAAPSLARPLLLMHGLLDDNVHVANTLRMSGALLAAGRPHELVLLPGTGHRAIGGAVTEALLGRQVSFLRHHLAATQVPAR
jgi:dipeptidyl-peptidase-4